MASSLGSGPRSRWAAPQIPAESGFPNFTLKWPQRCCLNCVFAEVAETQRGEGTRTVIIMPVDIVACMRACMLPGNPSGSKATGRLRIVEQLSTCCQFDGRSCKPGRGPATHRPVRPESAAVFERHCRYPATVGCRRKRGKWKGQEQVSACAFAFVEMVLTFAVSLTGALLIPSLLGFLLLANGMLRSFR